MWRGKMRRKVRRQDAAALDESTRVLAENTRAASEELRERDELGEKLPALREQETIRAAVLQRMAVERNSLDEEERRAEARRKELDQRLVQTVADLTREQETLRDTDGVIARLAEEDTALKASQDNDGDLRAEAALALQRLPGLGHGAGSGRSGRCAAFGTDGAARRDYPLHRRTAATHCPA